jgi:peptidyl-prolyl cis-trans isomerase B (cyclophilin B)
MKKVLAILIVAIISIPAIGSAEGYDKIEGLMEQSPTFNYSEKQRMELADKVINDSVELTGTERAVVKTNKGVFSFKLYSEDAPNTVTNFIRLAQAGFYDGLTWHRYVEGFVIQGGDPRGNGTGGSGHPITFEANDQTHMKGAVGMARSQDRNSATSQFYVCLEDQHQLDGGYVVFGQVDNEKEMEVVSSLRAQDSILKIVITRP